jgi:cyclic pyranopterin phosphate synthase
MPLKDITTIVEVLAKLGVTKYKITGGEPTLRADIVEIVSTIKAVKGVKNVTLTTNGLLLDKLSAPLGQAGLDAINVSLDSLDPNSYRRLTRNGRLEPVLAGLEAAYNARIPVKINCVPHSSLTEQDLLDLAMVAKERSIHVRFIELMPIGPAGELTGHAPDSIFAAIERRFGPLTPTTLAYGNGPASYYSLDGFKGLIGFLSALNSCFCERCNRIRVTSDGYLKTCLHLDKGKKLNMADKEDLEQTILKAVQQKPKRHLFNTPDARACDRPMNRIGG